MDVRKFPLNQKTTIIAEKFIMAVAERISNDEVVISYINLKNRKEVLRILQKSNSESQFLQYADADYWDIYMDGKYITNYDFSAFKDLDLKINVTTAEKSLDIESIGSGIPRRARQPFEQSFLNR